MTELNAATEALIDPHAWECHQKIVELRTTVERSFLELGGYLRWMKQHKAFRQFEHPTFESYLADPDVDIGRRSAYMAIRNFEVFVQRLHVDEVKLLEAGTSKLDIIAPHIDEENQEELINMACALSRSDLRDMVGQMFGIPPIYPTDYRTRYLFARRQMRRKYWTFNERRWNK